jgi:two-component system cell cycle sensor histidine kinase/response regulator CckA
VTVSLVRDNKGDPDYLVSIIEDISERKQTEIALLNSEEKFRALFEQAGGYCMVLDPNTADGIPMIIDANSNRLAPLQYIYFQTLTTWPN